MGVFLVRLVLVLLLYFALTLPAVAQRGDSWSEQVFTNRTTTGSSGAIRNIGQSQHYVWAQYTDNGGTCAAGYLHAVYLEASFDGSRYFAISPVYNGFSPGAASSTREAIITGNGTYPRLRLTVGEMPANCKLNAWYSGALPTLSLPHTVRQSALGYQTRILNNVTGPLVASVVTSPVLSGFQARVVVYGLWIFNATDAAHTVTIYSGAGNCAGATDGIGHFFFSLVAGRSLQNFPTSFVPYFATNPNSALCMEIQTAGTFSVGVVYRYE
jgi:hypothetical protein